MSTRSLISPLLLAAALLAAAPAYSQVRLNVSVGPLEVLIAPNAPPPVRVERRAVCPGPDFVWIDGYWDRAGERWTWCRGHWARPERPGGRWVAPVYRPEHGGYRYEPGHWSHREVVEGPRYERWRSQHPEARGHEGNPGRGPEGNPGRGQGRGHEKDRDHGREGDHDRR